MTIATKFGSMRTWHATIIHCEPYEYIDEVLDRPFKKWTHSHRFTKVENGKTLVEDQITFGFRYPIIGLLLEWFLVKKFSKMFVYREARVKELLEC